jgi:hypothetical protein
MTENDFYISTGWRPWEPLMHVQDCMKLTDIQFDYCIKGHPIKALKETWICDRLTDIQLDYCTKCVPVTALDYASHRLNPYQKAWCEKRKYPNKG